MKKNHFVYLLPLLAATIVAFIMAIRTAPKVRERVFTDTEGKNFIILLDSTKAYATDHIRFQNSDNPELEQTIPVPSGIDRVKLTNEAQRIFGAESDKYILNLSDIAVDPRKAEKEGSVTLRLGQ